MSRCLPTYFWLKWNSGFACLREKKGLSKCWNSYKRTQFIMFLCIVINCICQRESEARLLPKKTHLEPYSSGSKENLTHLLSEMKVCYYPSWICVSVGNIWRNTWEDISKSHCLKRRLLVFFVFLIYWLLVDFCYSYSFPKSDLPTWVISFHSILGKKTQQTCIYIAIILYKSVSWYAWIGVVIHCKCFFQERVFIRPHQRTMVGWDYSLYNCNTLTFFIL